MPTITPPPTLAVDAATPSESRQVALHGESRALTPILSGAISGGIIAVAWTIGIIVWLYKRRRRARRAKAAGFSSHRQFPTPLPPTAIKEKIIIPPDPALLTGMAKPGDKLIVEDDEEEKGIKHARTAPFAKADDKERVRGENECVPPGMDHRASAPCRVPNGLSTSHSSQGGP